METLVDTILTRSRWRPWSAAALSAAVVAAALPATVLLLDEIGQEYSFLALGGWLAILLALARLLPRVVPAGSGVASVAAVWLIQRALFLTHVPGKFLEYGFFLRSDGKVARFWVLEIPFSLGVLALLATLVWALVSGWRRGERWSLVASLLWWLAAFVVFSLPSIDVYLQGDAAIFI